MSSKITLCKIPFVFNIKKNLWKGLKERHKGRQECSIQNLGKTRLICLDAML